MTAMHPKLEKAIDTYYGAYLTTHGFLPYDEPASKLGEDAGYFHCSRYCLRFYRDVRDTPPPHVARGSNAATMKPAI
jgi:hypothetical protein